MSLSSATLLLIINLIFNACMDFLIVCQPWYSTEVLPDEAGGDLVGFWKVRLAAM